MVQIRETNAGNYPPVVYQPLRSPKSPFAKYGPGSSSTLPAKLGARLMSQTYNNNNINIGSAKGAPGGNLSAKQEIFDPEDTSLWPRFLHSPISPHDSKHQAQQQTSLTTATTRNNNKRQIRQAPHFDHSIDLNDSSAQHPGDHHMHRHNLHNSHHQPILTTDETSTGHLEHNHSSVDRDIRSSSEENSNASSDHTSVGYYSEDSSQSITDVCGSPLELKVQIRQCSDEKILKKNLSQDNLLQADFISRPNEKCKCSESSNFFIILLKLNFLKQNLTNYMIIFIISPN